MAVAVAPDGTTVAAWARVDRAAARWSRPCAPPPGRGTFGTPVKLTAAAPAACPQVGIDARRQRDRSRGRHATAPVGARRGRLPAAAAAFDGGRGRSSARACAGGRAGRSASGGDRAWLEDPQRSPGCCRPRSATRRERQLRRRADRLRLSAACAPAGSYRGRPRSASRPTGAPWPRVGCGGAAAIRVQTNERSGRTAAFAAADAALGPGRERTPPPSRRSRWTAAAARSRRGRRTLDVGTRTGPPAVDGDGGAVRRRQHRRNGRVARDQPGPRRAARRLGRGTAAWVDDDSRLAAGGRLAPAGGEAVRRAGRSSRRPHRGRPADSRRRRRTATPSWRGRGSTTAPCTRPACRPAHERSSRGRELASAAGARRVGPVLQRPAARARRPGQRDRGLGRRRRPRGRATTCRAGFDAAAPALTAVTARPPRRPRARSRCRPRRATAGGRSRCAGPSATARRPRAAPSRTRSARAGTVRRRRDRDRRGRERDRRRAPRDRRRADTSPAPAAGRARGRARAAALARARQAMKLERMRLTGMPAGAEAELRCKGKRCPIRRTRIFTPSRARRDRRRQAARPRPAPLPVPASGSTSASPPRAIVGQVLRFNLKRGREPKALLRCMPIGSAAIRRSC